MAFNQGESIDEEVKELLENYKNKKTTIYEPCTTKNVKECLIGLSEEFSLFNINYIFNPYIDIEYNSLQPEALVKFINTVWTLLHYHKNSSEKVEKLTEWNHILEHKNKQLYVSLSKLKDKLSLEKNEAKSCVATAQRAADHTDTLMQNLKEARAKLTMVTKQKETLEKSLRHEIMRLKMENNKLVDNLRNKSGSHIPCSEVCDSTLMQLKERERKQRAVISQLQANNQELLREILTMKEQIILGGLSDLSLQDKTRK